MKLLSNPLLAEGDVPPNPEFDALLGRISQANKQEL